MFKRKAADPKNETRRLIYEHLQHAPERQLGDNNDLDTKAASLFGVASVVMGLASFGNIGAGTGGSERWTITALLILAVAAYLRVATSALGHLRPTEQDRTTYANTLWDNFKDRTPEELRAWLVRQTKNAWNVNQEVTTAKGKALTWIVKGLAVEVVAVAAALIVSRF